MTSFADRVEHAVQVAYATDYPMNPSRAQIEEALLPLINELQQMPRDQAVAYIRQSYSHVGYQALAVRLFKGQPT